MVSQDISQDQKADIRSGPLESDEVDGESAITLGLLDAVHQNSSVSQRSLAAELGIALGLTNAYFKRCVRKGLVKVRSAPANRYAYYLTPKGFAEKANSPPSIYPARLVFTGGLGTNATVCWLPATKLDGSA